MATPEQAGRFLPAPARRVVGLRARLRVEYRRLMASDARFVPWVVLGALLLTPGVAVENWQYVGLVLSVVCSAAVYRRWPTAGLALLVFLWTFSPLIRRLLDYYAGYQSGPDILSLAPFIATLVVGGIALRAQPPSRAVVIVLGTFTAGLLYATPTGVDDPFALMFALFSYPAAAVGLLIGYRDHKRGRLSLEQILLVLTPVIAAYAIYQYLVSALPPWDALWLKTDAPISTGAKETKDFRAFSVVNSPGSLAGVLSLFGLMLIVSARMTTTRILAGALTMAALAFTQVRSAWLAMGAAMVVLVALSRGRILARVGVLLVVLGAMYVAVGDSGSGRAVVDRAASVTSGTGDGSIRARIEAMREFGPQAATAPLGNGLGSAGQAARVSLKGAPFVDNGYLTILWQGGIVGFVLMMGSLAYGTIYGLRNLNSYRRAERFPLLAIIVAASIMHASGDQLFGLPAVILWYSLGALMASAEDPECRRITERRRRARRAGPPPRPPVGGAIAPSAPAPARSGAVSIPRAGGPDRPTAA